LNAKNKPFFLTVEGSQIDSCGHYSTVAGIILEGIDFDKAITEAIKFADQTAILWLSLRQMMRLPTYATARKFKR
jgi:alkaline phosphatase